MADRLTSLKKFLELDPDDTFTKYAVALEYLSQKNYQQAEKYLESIIETDGDYLAAYQQLGHLLAVNNNKSKAIEIYKKGIEVAKKTGDKHTVEKLAAALEELS